MSILLKEGKEKIHFSIMNNRVTERDFEYLKRLFLECLEENHHIDEQLDRIYQLIQVYFFHEVTDSKVENSLRTILNDQSIKSPKEPNPAFTQSKKNFGCIMVFVKHLQEFTRKRSDITDIQAYHKNGIFEELCHLVEQNGDSSIHPESYWTLWRLYKNQNLLQYGNEIIAQLDTDRNHYEVYLMVIRAYPNDWIKRYWRYFMAETKEQYEQKYQQWKNKILDRIVYARLITDTLRNFNAYCVAKKVPKEKLSDENKELLDKLIETGKLRLEQFKSLIEKDVGFDAPSLINSLDESIFKTPESFFNTILSLWKSLYL